MDDKVIVWKRTSGGGRNRPSGNGFCRAGLLPKAMSPGTMLDAGDEAALQGFLAALPASHAVPVRTLAHAWQASGGTLQVGRVTVRLVSPGRDGRPFTAATLHAALGERPAPRSADLRTGPGLELARVLLFNHGVSDADWRAWCDELADLAPHGLDAAAKYPTIALDRLAEAQTARLAQALRDLGRLSQGQPA